MRTIPSFIECEVCGLPVEPGDGPAGAAWHDCRWVLDRQEGRALEAADAADPMGRLVRAIVHQVEKRGDSLPSKDLANLLMAAAEHKPAERGDDDLKRALQEWLREPADGPDPLGP